MKLPFMSFRRGTDPAAAAGLDQIIDRLDRLIALGERTNELLERFESPTALPEPETNKSAPSASDGAAGMRSRPGPTQILNARQTEPTGGRRQRSKSGGTPARVARAAPAKLHEAIIQVLLDAGEPLTANDIAARIRERNLFEPPRSGHELRGGQVSARVGNAHYRGRFVRRDGRIWLADPDGERLGRMAP